MKARRSVLLMAGMLAAAVLGLGAMGARPAAAADATNVKLCSGTNLSGACITLTGSIADLRTVNFNDVTQSIQMTTAFCDPWAIFTPCPNSGSFTAWTDVNFQGRCLQLFAAPGTTTTLDSLVGRWVGPLTISSLQFDTECPPGVWLCSDSNYNGTCQQFTATNADLRSQPIGNDRASSVHAFGFTTRLYHDIHCGGAYLYLDGTVSGQTIGGPTWGADVADLRGTTVGNDAVSSLALRYGNVDWGPC